MQSTKARERPYCVHARERISFVISCPLCATKTDKVLARELRRGKGIVYHCSKCDLGFLLGAGHTDYTGAYRYSASHKADGSGGSVEEIYRAYAPFQTRRLQLVNQLVKPDSAVLELGASAGQFISQLTCAKRCAIEPDEDARAFMAGMGISVDERPFPDSFFRDDRFDVVCAFQVLEHVDEPITFLRDVKQALKPGGVAFIEVPNLYDALRTSWAVREYDRFYFHADHRWYFSAASLKAVACIAGFEKAEVSFVQDYNVLNHLHWLINRAPQADCRCLGPVAFVAEDRALAHWLSDTMKKVDELYTIALVERGETSNLMLELRV